MRIGAFGAAVAIGLGLLAGCSLKKSEPPDYLPTVRPDPGSGVLVVFRSTIRASACYVTIQVDGQKVGRLASNEYIVVEAPAGRHRVSATPYEECNFPASARNTHEPMAVDVELVPGRNKFLAFQVALPAQKKSKGAAGAIGGMLVDIRNEDDAPAVADWPAFYFRVREIDQEGYQLVGHSLENHVKLRLGPAK